MKLFFTLILSMMFYFFVSASPSMADPSMPLQGAVDDPFVEAQEKLMYAKGSYKTITQQQKAVQDMRKAVKLSLKASKLRAKAEKLQNKANLLVTRSNQDAINKGIYITNPLSPVMMQPPPGAEAKAPKPAPVPGQPINIILPKQDQVSYDGEESTDSESDTLPAPPPMNNF